MKMRRIVKNLALSALLLVLIVVLALITCVLWPVEKLEPAVSSGPIAIANVTVIDTEDGTQQRGMTVVVAGDRIVSVGPADSVVAPDAAEIIDGSGKYLLPAFWDMHVHIPLKLSPQLYLPLFIAHGVTKVRVMSGDCHDPGDPLLSCIEDQREWNRQIMAGELVGPRITAVGSFPINGPVKRREGWPPFFGPGTEAEASHLVHHLMERGVDFIKVYSYMPRDPFFALMNEAEKAGIEAMGHKPLAVSAIEASNAGMKSLEHAQLFLFECYPGAEKFRRTTTTRNPSTLDRREMLDAHDSAMCDAVFETFVQNGTWYCPTHLTRKMDAFADDETYRNDPRLTYVARLQRKLWNADADGMIEHDPSPEGRKAYMDFYLAGLELTGRAHEAGVKVLAGTDATDTYVFPGSSLHDELEELVAAGLTPAEALRASTVGPAEYFGLTEDYGTVAAGRVADLVLLDANPLDEIANTRAIYAVVFNGNLYTRADLGRLLDYVEEQANSFAISSRVLWGYIRKEMF
jgi:hypothetical protein